MIYERTFSETRSIYNEEEARHFRVRILLLEDEKDDVQNQLAQCDRRVDQLENNEIRTQNQLTMAAKSLEKARLDLGAKLRENELQKVTLSTNKAMRKDAK